MLPGCPAAAAALVLALPGGASAAASPERKIAMPIATSASRAARARAIVAGVTRRAVFSEAAIGADHHGKNRQVKSGKEARS